MLKGRGYNPKKMLILGIFNSVNKCKLTRQVN